MKKLVQGKRDLESSNYVSLQKNTLCSQEIHAYFRSKNTFMRSNNITMKSSWGLANASILINGQSQETNNATIIGFVYQSFKPADHQIFTFAGPVRIPVRIPARCARLCQ